MNTVRLQNQHTEICCTNIATTETEIKKTTPFTIVPKIIKYLGIILTKEVRDLYSENYKTLIKEIEDDTKKWKDIPCSLIRRTNIVKCLYYPN